MFGVKIDNYCPILFAFSESFLVMHLILKSHKYFSTCRCDSTIFYIFREKVDLDAEFKPNVLNSAVYVMSMALQVSTFAVNYRVRS